MRIKSPNSSCIASLFNVFCEKSKCIIEQAGYDVDQFEFQIYPMQIKTKNESPIPKRIAKEFVNVFICKSK